MLQKIIFLICLAFIAQNTLADDTTGAASVVSSIKLYLGIFLAFMLFLLWKMKSCLTKIVLGVTSILVACYCFFKFF